MRSVGAGRTAAGGPERTDQRVGLDNWIAPGRASRLELICAGERFGGRRPQVLGFVVLYARERQRRSGRRGMMRNCAITTGLLDGGEQCSRPCVLFPWAIGTRTPRSWYAPTRCCAAIATWSGSSMLPGPGPGGQAGLVSRVPSAPLSCAWSGRTPGTVAGGACTVHCHFGVTRPPLSPSCRWTGPPRFWRCASNSKSRPNSG
jgi:hypothetical protein